MLFFSVLDEGSSLYLARNMANFLPALAGGSTVIMDTSADEASGVRIVGSSTALQAVIHCRCESTATDPNIGSSRMFRKAQPA